MKNQPNRNYNSNDRVMTPPELVRKIVLHFEPRGTILEPCCGDGAFLNELVWLGEADWCEIDKGRDFFEYSKPCDWIVTNPPWSQITEFMRHSFELANDVVFLMTVNHAFTTCRERIAREAGFSLKSIVYLDWPKGFPKSGFLLGAVHWTKGPYRDVEITDCRN